MEALRVELADGTELPCGPGETLLLAALRAGLDFPYECASGSCGSCRCRVLKGSVASLWAEAPGLSARDRLKGDRVLACQSVPTSDVVLGGGARGRRVGPRPARARAEVVDLEGLNASVARLVLRLPGAAEFLPGQFVVLDVPGAGRRAYSMANLPNPEGRLELIIKRKVGGRGTTYLMDHLAVGETLRVEGPYGRAHLRPSAGRARVAVAGGSGLAPMLSIARGAVEAGLDEPLELYFGVNSAADLFAVAELEQLARVGRGRLGVHLVVRDGPLPDAPLPVSRGLVGVALVEREPHLGAKDLYLAGPAPMVDDILARTVRTGWVPAERVFFDRFV